MGCFFGSCFSPDAGLPAKLNGGDGWTAGVQLRSAKCHIQETRQEAVTADALWACYSVGTATEHNSSSCEESDTSSLPHDQAKGFREILSSEQKRTCKPAPTAAAAHKLYPYIVQHGRGVLSLSTLQEGLQHFVVPGVGYIAYALMYNGPEILNVTTPVALGDPICDSRQYHAIAKAFLEQHPKAMFMQISAAFAAVLQSLGLLVNSVGGETHLDLATYTFAGYAKRGIRSAITSAAKEGVTVEEVMGAPVAAEDVAAAGAAVLGGMQSDWSAVAAEMQQVDKEWLLNKGRHAGRVWFLNRQPVFAPEPGVRKLTARDRAGHLLGFIFFDAVYEGGQLAGYYANVTRMRPDAHPGVLNLVVKEFVDRVRAELQLAAPAKKLSMKKSLKKKLEQQQLLQPKAADGTAAEIATGGTTKCSSSGSGVRFVSLGLSPLHHMDDSSFAHSSSVRKLLEWSYHHGSGYYPFKPLAAAKAKYGAGLHNGTYEDPAVTYQQVYLAHSHTQGAAAAVAMFDLAKLVGFWKHPADAAALVIRENIRKRVLQLKRQLKQRKQQQQLDSNSSSRMAPVAAAAPAVAAGPPAAKGSIGKSKMTASTLAASCKPPAAAAAGGVGSAAAAAVEGSKIKSASSTASAAYVQDALLLYTSTSLSDTSSLIGTAPRGASYSSSSESGA